MGSVKYLDSVLVLILFTLTVSPVFAGDWDEGFRGWLLGSKAQAAILDRPAPGLDGVADECMQCHNGVRATHIAVKSADAPMQFVAWGPQVNHPVGMSYAEYAARKPRSYTSRFSLDPKITLVAGKVTCISCHQLKHKDEVAELTVVHLDSTSIGPASKDNCTASNQLTVGPRETDLCLACHNM